VPGRPCIGRLVSKSAVFGVPRSVGQWRHCYTCGYNCPATPQSRRPCHRFFRARTVFFFRLAAPRVAQARHPPDMDVVNITCELINEQRVQTVLEAVGGTFASSNVNVTFTRIVVISANMLIVRTAGPSEPCAAHLVSAGGLSRYTASSKSPIDMYQL
jgi:hypothetical protein